MSDNKQGDGWWQASDGKWYPPDHHPSATPPLSASGPQVPKHMNGLAVAALTLGIVGVFFGLIPILFFIALALGILGVIFGFAGRKRAKTAHSGKGMATAGLVLGAVAILLGIVGVAIVGDAITELGDALDELTGEHDPDDYTLTEDPCEVGEFGEVEFTGTITNDSDRELSFTIETEFLSPDGTRVGTGVDFVSNLAPGRTATWSAGMFLRDPLTGLECRVDRVAR